MLRRMGGPGQRLKLPIYKTIDKLRVCIDWFNLERFEEAYSMLTNSFSKGEGFGKNEIRRETVYHRMSENQVYCATNIENNDLIAVLNVYPSPLCRSTQPLAVSGLLITNPQNRGAGVGMAMLQLAYLPQANPGCVGFLGRTALISKTILPGMKTGTRLNASIPYASKPEKIGLIDDLVFWKDLGVQKSHPEYYQSLLDSHAVLPSVVREDVEVWWQGSGKLYEPTPLSCDIPGACIRPTLGHETWSVESIFRDSAIRGEGFAVDEFTKHGHFNKHLMSSTDTFLIEAEGRLLGGAMFGSSALVRAEHSHVATCYLAILPKYRGKGLGREVLRYFGSLALQQQYKMLIVDCLLPQPALLRLLQREGFHNCGSLPYCAYLKDIGPVDSMLFYKDLQLHSSL